MVIGAWLIALSLVGLAGFLAWQARQKVTAVVTTPSLPAPTEFVLATATVGAVTVALPDYTAPDLTLGADQTVSRLAMLHTIIPTRPRQDVISYTVSTGDSIFGIAEKFNIKPETILWANERQLADDPDSISPGVVLNIPPINGVYYQWKSGDTPESVATEFEAKAEDIITWAGNKVDLADPTIKPGTWVMVPDGHREFKRWVVPVIPRGPAGVSRNLGAGYCDTGEGGAQGLGYFVWPTATNFLSGNDFWSGHLGIDIAGGVGDGIFASDSGVVVYAGWNSSGYGNLIVIDHGYTGYQTVYAHLSAISVRCGQSVYQGQYIGAMGSTGNSTGPHLHFEVRYLGGFINPWHVLP
jgi:murein DD-endopeptidase MepM/ murein hydrolase activator NlpD